MSQIRRYLGAALAVTLAASSSLMAAPALTTIQDTLYKANGAPFTGTATISWNSFVAADGSVIPQNTITVPINSGALYVRLAPTAGLPGAPSYSVQFTTNGVIQFAEVWVVPASPVPVKLSVVRAGGQGGGTVPNQLVTGDILGLDEELLRRPRKGLIYEFNRVALVDSTGDLSTVQGPAADCVRVDGTSSPCGTAGGPTGPSFVDLQTPSGTVDGQNVVFQLQLAPSPSTSLHLYRNGILQRPGVDFSLNGNTVTFNTVSTPQQGDLLAASYRY